jgi:xanthine dehydrogenase iron-sulfur cluster and FAD-binding subunit A
MDVKKSESQTSLIFAINGEKFELSNIDPSTTLLEFLRTKTRFKSVKLGCGEGIFIIIIHNLTYICLYKLTV